MEQKRIGRLAIILSLLVMGGAFPVWAQSPNSQIKEISYQEFLDNPASAITENKVLDAKASWTNTGIFLEKGNLVHINASGSWVGGPFTSWYGPDGRQIVGGRMNKSCVYMALIGRIENFESFCVGSNKTFMVNSNGFIYFMPNDTGRGDNKGSVTLEIAIKKASTSASSISSSSSSLPMKKVGDISLAIFDIHSINVSYDESQVLTSFLRSQMAQTNFYTIVERQYIQKILKEQGLQQLDIFNQDTAVHLGKLVGAKKVLLGEVGQIGQTYTLTFRLVDVETGVVDKTASKACKCAKDELVNVISELAAQLGK